ncbi:MAG: T9SS type A sorting domain-containing protein, partial [Cyclobacteriaceae bacterium]
LATNCLRLQPAPYMRVLTFTIGLNQGWNQIGNPYLVPIKWSDVKAFNSTVSGVGDLKLYDSNGRAYVDGDAMAVYEGGFVFANETVQNYAISFAGQAPGGRKKSQGGRKFSPELDSERWRTMFTLKQSDVEFKLGGIGMSPDAKISYDDNDDVTLPRLTDFLEVNFHHPEHFAKRFSRDIVPTQGEYTWEFTVDSNLEGIASVEWNNEAFGLNDRDLYLLDVAQQKLVDMRDVNSYSFYSEESNKFKVYYGSNLKGRIQPEKILLGHAWPNPAREVTTIPFTLPASNEMYQVRLEVYDMMGRRVSVLHEGQLPSGFYESQWNTSAGQWTNGIYTYRLAVAGAGKSEVFSNKIILNK